MKKNEALITIIVPIYNAEKYLKKCLGSLQKQTHKNLQIILIDDGSTDNSSLICKEFYKEDLRFCYIYQNNQGVSAARNEGLKYAKGEYIAFCDSDDWVELDMYESLYNIIIHTDADIAINSFIFEKEGVINSFSDDEKTYLFTSKEAIKEMCLGEKFAGHLCNKLIRRDIINGLFLNEKIAIFEDMLFMWDIFYKAKKIVFQNIHKYHYEINPSSAMHCFKPSMWTVQTACNLIYNKTMEALRELKIYAQKTIIVGNITLANALYMSNNLTKENYKKINQYIKPNFSKEVLLLFSGGFKWEVKMFILGHKPYLLYMGLRQNKLLRKLFGKR